uniref:Ovule protein n=1 Tax=Steinernema glaseri TaxID=37863 RepID=A0A1I7ZQI6_9BILA
MIRKITAQKKGRMLPLCVAETRKLGNLYNVVVGTPIEETSGSQDIIWPKNDSVTAEVFPITLLTLLRIWGVFRDDKIWIFVMLGYRSRKRASEMVRWHLSPTAIICFNQCKLSTMTYALHLKSSVLTYGYKDNGLTL